MRRTVTVLLGVLATIAVASPAYAQSSVSDIVAKLQSSPVFVQAGTPGTTRTTASAIAARITSSDPVVIVMVPPSSTIDPDDLAQQVDDATGNKFIVGVSVGAKTAGAASILPAGVASDQMHRAATVATSSTEAMTTYITNVHDYLKQHPLPKPSPAASKAKNDGHKFSPIMAGLVTIVLIIVGVGISFIIWSFFQVSDSAETIRPNLPDPPGPIKDLLHQVERRAPGINDVKSRATLISACDETKVMFARLGKESQVQSNRLATEAFQTHLANLIAVLDTYLDIQNHPSYWDNPGSLLADGQESITSYASDVLETIKSLNRKTAFDFQVKTSILKANRLSN